MNKQKNIQEKWKIMIQSSKEKFVFVKVPLLRIVPLVAFISTINALIMGYGFGFNQYEILQIVIKLILAYGLGMLIGHMEWNFYKNLVENKFESLSKIKNQYQLIYGVLSYGLVIMLSQIDYGHQSLVMIAMNLLIWSFAGLFFGYIFWGFTKAGFVKYLKKS